MSVAPKVFKIFYNKKLGNLSDAFKRPDFYLKLKISRARTYVRTCALLFGGLDVQGFAFRALLYKFKVDLIEISLIRSCAQIIWANTLKVARS